LPRDFGERFRNGLYSVGLVSTVWTVYCLLFFYSQCPISPAICKSVGERAPCLWSGCHWCQMADASKVSGKLRNEYTDILLFNLWHVCISLYIYSTQLNSTRGWLNKVKGARKLKNIPDSLNDSQVFLLYYCVH